VELGAEDEAQLVSLNRDPGDYVEEIEEGTLRCGACDAEYPIVRGVPRFATELKPDVESVMQTYGEQWAAFSYGAGRIWHWPIEDRIRSFLFEIDSSPDELRGKLVLDAGCGSGITISQVSKRFAAEVVGLDLSNAVEAAHLHNSSPLCHFVQASVFDPPLKPKAFDIVYSHGVLMMTPDTRRAFRSIAPLASPGGNVYLWVYGKKRGWQRVKFLLVDGIRFVVNRLPENLQAVAVAGLATVSQVVQFVKQRLGTASVPMPTWTQAKMGVRDRYTHRYRREHTEAEVRGWFEEVGLRDLTARQEMIGAPWTVGTTDIGILSRVP
jgi:SAM-dependent methyltransferase